MLLPLPQLDDTRWADLVEESRSLIPVYAPEWTDHNVSDPGITILDLLAWITEMQVFELDRVPARHRRRFLALVGLWPLPPRPARAVVRLGLPAGSQPRTLPAGTVCETGEGVAFRTLRPVTVVGVRVDRLTAAGGGAAVDLTGRWRRGEPIAPFGDDPRPGATFELGLDAELPAGERMSLALTCATDRAGPEERARIGAPALHHDVRTAWEVRIGPGTWRMLDPDTGELADQTRALTLDGTVELTVRWPLHADAEGRYGLRCRHLSGAYDDAPLLADVALNGVTAEQSVAAVAAWVVAKGAQVPSAPGPGDEIHLGIELDREGRVTKLDTADQDAPAVRVLAYRAPDTAKDGELVLEADRVGHGTGGPDQSVALEPAPVDAHTVHVWTREQDGAHVRWRRWELVRDLESAGAADAHAVLDAGSGELSFGDGEHGLAPPPGTTIVAVHRCTRAELGNVPAGAIDGFAAGPLNPHLPEGTLAPAVINPLPAAGGEAAETLEHAEGRAGELAGAVTRAVTLDDLRRLALDTPGVHLARAEARANLHPAFPCVLATGVMTVVVVPHLPRARPLPSRATLRVVAARLEAHRVIGSRIEVAAPEYTEVSVRARVRARPLADAAELRRRVVAALDGFLDPLRGGGDGQGWPLGRDVVTTEVLRVIDDVPGADHVLAVELIGPDGASCGNLCIGPLGLVHAGVHQIEVVTR